MGVVREPTAAGQIRRQVLFFAPIPLLLLGLLALVLRGEWSAPGWTILLSGSVSVGSLLLAVVAQPTPLPEGMPPEVSVRRSLYRFQQITSLRIGLAMTPVVMGAAAAVAGGGLFPYAVALALAWPQLLLALPGYFTVSRSRRAMEAWGTKAYLWAGLAQAAPVEWPLVTRYLARRRAKATGSRPESRGRAGGEGAERGARTAKTARTEAESPKNIPGVPERLVPPSEPMTSIESLIPGFTASGGTTPQPSLQLLRLRANTRPKQRGHRTEQQRRKAKNG
ncbi:hypothetical protein [Actinorugispora endophytica]|uniref:hypothetical protein n=1 Tax=Actinorugispora endophytica TaxID=1605990 RepID=UPI001FB5FEEF|nr:hypothetical protein [Actinorugispora endophytica]